MQLNMLLVPEISSTNVDGEIKINITADSYIPRLRPSEKSVEVLMDCPSFSIILNI